MKFTIESMYLYACKDIYICIWLNSIVFVRHGNKYNFIVLNTDEIQTIYSSFK